LANPGKDKDGRRSVSDIVLRAGAVAGALASIVGLGALLWPDSPGRLAASLENVEADVNVGLAEFSARQRTAEAGTAVEITRPPGGARPYTVLAGVQSERDLAQQPEPEGAPESPPAEAPPEATSPAEPEVDPQAQPETGVEPEMETGAQRQLDELSEAQVVDEVEEKLPSEKLPPGCEYELAGGDGAAELQCAHVQALRFLAPGDVDEESSGQATVAAKDLLKVLRGTRVRPLSGGTSEPLGATLNFDLSLEGYEGKRVEVRWSLYNARADVRVPRDWLVNRRALVAEPDAPSERASNDFWVPLPRQRGPFFVRLTAYDGGTRIARADSETFR
jgi:hypothetical protein